MRSEIALNYKKYFVKKRLKKLPTKIRYKGWFLLKKLEQRKVRKIYGNITLTRLKFIYKNILKNKGNFFFNFLKTLEYRLDILVFKLNLFTTLNYCQYLIRNKNVLVNNLVKNLNFIVKIEDIIKIKSSNRLKTEYALYFVYKDTYYKKLKQAHGIYLYRFLFNLNIFQNLKQIYFYIKKGFILINKNVIKFPRYKVAFNSTKIIIKNLGIKKKLIIKNKGYFLLNYKKIKNIKYINSFYNFSYLKLYFLFIYNFFNIIKYKNINKKYNLLFNFLNLDCLQYNYNHKIWKLLKLTTNNNIFNIINKLYILNYKKPQYIKYKSLINIFMNKHYKKKQGIFKLLYNKRKKKLIIFKLKKKLYFINNSNNFFNKNFRRFKLYTKIYKFSVSSNSKLLLKYNFLKKYSLNRIKHLEINYKIKNAIVLKYFDINTISSKDIIYLGIISYYFFQYT